MDIGRKLVEYWMTIEWLDVLFIFKKNNVIFGNLKREWWTIQDEISLCCYWSEQFFYYSCVIDNAIHTIFSFNVCPKMLAFNNIIVFFLVLLNRITKVELEKNTLIKYFLSDSSSFNILMSGETHLCQWIGSVFIQVMNCHLTGINPLPKPMPSSHHVDPQVDQTLMQFTPKYKHFLLRICT